MAEVITKRTYPVRTDVAQEVQQELLQVQAQRQLKGERVSLMTIAAEWLEEIAQQKKAERI